MDCGVPFCNYACPLGNLIPDWNDLVRRGDWKAHRAAARDQQLPRVHRPDLPGAVRVGLRARDRRRPGDDQADRVRDRPPRLRAGLGAPRPPARRTGQTVAVIGSGPGRARGRRRAQPGRPHGHRLRARRGARRADPLRRPRREAREVDDRPPRRRCSRARGSRFGYGVEVGGDVSAGELAEANDAVVIAIGSRVERDFEVPGRELDGVHFAMEYLYQRNRWVARARAPAPRARAGRRDHRRRQARRRDRRRRHRDGLRLQRQPRGGATGTLLDVYPEVPDDGRYADTPWPMQPKRSFTTYALDEGGEREFGHQVIGLEGDGRVTRAGRQVTGNSSRTLVPVPGSEYDEPADLVLIAIGFTHPAHDGVVAGSASTSTAAATSAAKPSRPRGRRLRRRRRPRRPVADRHRDRRGPPLRPGSSIGGCAKPIEGPGWPAWRRLPLTTGRTDHG